MGECQIGTLNIIWEVPFVVVKLLLLLLLLLFLLQNKLKELLHAQMYDSIMLTLLMLSLSRKRSRRKGYYHLKRYFG